MGNKVIENARESLSGLSGDEKREALRALRRLIDEELFGLATEGEPDDAPPSDSCPRCGSWKVAKRGRDAKGGQRYLCGACEKSFSASTLKVFAATKLDHATWMRYAECHVDLDTLREV